MADATNNETISETIPAAAETVAKTADTVVKAAAKPARAKRAAKPAADVVEAVAKVNRRAAKTVRKARVVRAKRKTAAAAPRIERTETMTTDFTTLFGASQLPGADKFQTLFADAAGRTQELTAKSRKAAEEATEIAKANVEALVEAGRIAANGARAIGQDVFASSREGLEQAAQSLKTLSQAGSPSEYFQLQSELARGSFDRMVAESSKLTEALVKLAGEAIQPIQNRASVNAERVNELMA